MFSESHDPQSNMQKTAKEIVESMEDKEINNTEVCEKLSIQVLSLFLLIRVYLKQGTVPFYAR